MKTKFYWHIHHDKLCELATEPIKNRIAYIKENKPENEIELRLKLLKPVQGKLPDRFIEAETDLVKAWVDLDKARNSFGKAWADYDKARVDCNKAWADCKEEIEALHKKECFGCTWNGKEIVF